MYSLLIYVLATSCLLTGSILTYNNNLSDYFYISGSGLFFLRSIFELFNKINKINKINKTKYHYLNLDINNKDNNEILF